MAEKVGSEHPLGRREGEVSPFPIVGALSRNRSVPNSPFELKGQAGQVKMFGQFFPGVVSDVQDSGGKVRLVVEVEGRGRETVDPKKFKLGGK